MGWTSELVFFNRKDRAAVRAFAKKCFEESYGQPPIYLVHYGNTFYAALHLEDKNEIFAAVLRLSFSGSTHEVTWKLIDESEGPVYADAPRRLISRLSPPQNQYAADWRTRCLENAEKRSRARRYQTGDVIHFTQPISFQNGDELSDFVLIKEGRRCRFAEYSGEATLAELTAHRMACYLIGRWKSIPHTQVKHLA